MCLVLTGFTSKIGKSILYKYINDGKEVSIKPKQNNQNTKRLWGMNRSLINNAIIGTSKGYEKILEWHKEMEKKFGSDFTPSPYLEKVVKEKINLFG